MPSLLRLYLVDLKSSSKLRIFPEKSANKVIQNPVVGLAIQRGIVDREGLGDSTILNPGNHAVEDRGWVSSIYTVAVTHHRRLKESIIVGGIGIQG